MQDEMVVSSTAISLIGKFILWAIAVVSALYSAVKFVFEPRIKLIVTKQLSALVERIERLEEAMENLRTEAEVSKEETRGVFNQMTETLGRLTRTMDRVEQTSKTTEISIATIAGRLAERDRREGLDR